MPFPLLSAIFKKYVIPAYSWLKAKVIDNKTGETAEISSHNSTNFFGNANIQNMNNYTIEFNINKDDPNYDGKKSREIIDELTKGVSDHDGYGLTFGYAVQMIKTTPLTQHQISSIKIFRKCDWPEDILTSLKIAYKIYNLEETGNYEQAKNLMTEAFNGRTKYQIRKLYNLARAGYMESFALSASMSPMSYGKGWIGKIMSYFPEAIFIDLEATKSDILAEFEIRERKNVQQVTLFARGTKIQTLKEGYWEYLFNKKIRSEKSPNVPFKIYTATDNKDYKIAWSSAKHVITVLKQLKEVPPDLMNEWEYF